MPAPPPLSLRIAQALKRRVAMARHRGDVVACPLCGHTWDGFAPAPNRPDALCWRCGAHERHRALGLLLFDRRPDLLEATTGLLHFAPEYCLQGPLRGAAARRGFRYVTGDLDPAGVDLQLDLTALELPDAAFDAVLCSHVLEHIPQDAQAMRELRRVTAPGGWCLVLVPLDLDRTHTYEDPAVATPEARVAAFWQHDHVRLYAPDIADRLVAAGFDVAVLRPAELFGDAALRRHGVLASDWMFLCR